MAGSTLDDVRTAAEVSGSQLSHYFAGKDELVQGVIDHQADIIVGNQEQADLGTTEGIRAWRDMVIAAASSTSAKGGCPLGSLGGQLAETDPEARALIAAGFARWSSAIGDGLRSLPSAGRLPAGVTPDDLAVTLLAALQAGSSLPRSSAIPAHWKPPSTPSSPSPPPVEPAWYHRRGGTRPAPRGRPGGG